MMTTYDALVVGAGYIGCAVAYHLAAAGVRTALLERGGVAAGASRANYGNVQIQDAELAHSLPLVTAGATRFARLESELGRSVGYRQLGSLLLIETEAQWAMMSARLPALRSAGIQAELIPAERLPEIEPLLNPRSVLGACYHPAEGQVNPFLLVRAFLARGRDLGLEVHTHTAVTHIRLKGGRVEGVTTPRGEFSAGTVILATGAWTAPLGQALGRSWPAPHVHGQALITEPTVLRLHNHIASAAFFEAIEQEDDQPGAVLAISQTAHGHFLLGEAGTVTTERTSAATAAGQTAIAALMPRYFPALRRLRVLRGWGAPVAFTGDGLPLFGPVHGIDGLILATAFKSTVIVTPLVGETVAQLVTTGQTTLDLRPFAPDRMGAYAP
jgi:glycine/D-amino acid oxidase-like deaminating enzyme